jgi:hypothetical protein
MKLTSSAVVVVLLAVAGCGGSDGSFTQDYNQAVKPLRELGAGMGTQPRAFARLAERTEQTRANLSKLDAPDGAQDEFDALLGRLDQVTMDLRGVARAERSRDVARQREAAKALVRSSTAVQRAETALKQAVEG